MNAPYPKFGLIDLAPYLTPADPRSHEGPDNSPVLRKIIAGLDTDRNRGATLRFPWRFFNFKSPVVVDKPYVTIEGAGPQTTTLSTHTARGIPLFVLHPPGDEMPDDARPTLDGVLDGTVTGYGFRTLGRYTAVGVCSPVAWGRRHPTILNTCWDYYGSLPSFAFEIAYEADLQPGEALVCVGETLRVYRNGQGQYQFNLLVTTPEGATESREIVFEPRPNAAGLDRLRLAVDFGSGRYEVTDHGTPANGVLLAGKSLQGCRLAANYDAPFGIGFDGVNVPRATKVPDITVYGMRFSARWQDEPANGQDLFRYFSSWADDTIWCLSPDKSSGRFLVVLGGSVAGEAPRSVLTVVDSSSELRGVEGFRLRNLSVWCASPAVLIGQARNVVIEDCDGLDGGSFIDFLRTGAAYPVEVRNCRIAGSHVAATFAGCMAYLDGVTVEDFGGPSAVRAVGSDLTWNTGRVWHASPQCESIVSLLGQDDGGTLALRDIVVDDEEANHAAKALIVARRAKSTRTSLTVDGFKAVCTKPGGVGVLLVGTDQPDASDNGTAKATVRGLVVSGVGAAVKCTGYGWSADVDASLVKVQTDTTGTTA